MKKHTIGTDIYKLSSTLYGAERFKIIIESINHLEEKGGEYSVDDIPEIDIDFNTTRERESYRKIKMDFYVVNMVLFPMLVEPYFLVMGGLSLLVFDKQNNYSNKLYLLLGRIRFFFKLYSVINNLRKLHSIDLLTFRNRSKVEGYCSDLEYFNCSFSKTLELDPINAISGFSEEETKEIDDHVHNIIDGFCSIGMID